MFPKSVYRQSALDQPLEHVRCQLETRNQKHFTSKFAFFFLYKFANINVNISVQETNSAIPFITFSYKSQRAHKKKSLLNQKKIWRCLISFTANCKTRYLQVPSWKVAEKGIADIACLDLTAFWSLSTSF